MLPVSRNPRKRRVGVAWVLAPLALVAACQEQAVAPAAAPVAKADLQIVNLPATDPDPASHATCQTGAALVLSAEGSNDPAGMPLTFEWRDDVVVDIVNGKEVIAPSTDWGPDGNVIRTDELELGINLYTVSFHYLTLTVRTRDGRTASETLRVTVTSCENCGTP